MGHMFLGRQDHHVGSAHIRVCGILFPIGVAWYAIGWIYYAIFTMWKFAECLVDIGKLA